MTRRSRSRTGTNGRGNGAASLPPPNGTVADTPGVAAVQSAIVAAEPALVECDTPPGFEMKETGLFRVSKEGAFFVCAPFEILAESRPDDNQEWGLLLRWQDRDGRVHEWIMPRRLLAGDAVEVRARLVACGLHVGASQGARNALIEFLSAVKTPARVRTTTRTGWYFPKDGAPCFVLPGRTIGHAGGERVRLDIDPAPQIYRATGTLDGWRDEVAGRCIGNPRLLFAVSCSYAALLLGLLGDEGGGVHMQGGSSQGKTTLVNAAASVWGAPSNSGPHAFVNSWHATATALETAAAAHNDMLLPLDEVGEADPAKLAGAIYMLMNGSGKARGLAGGGNRPRVTWRTLILSSGEESAARAVEQIGRHVKAGVETRLLDIPAEVPGAHGVFEHLHDAPGAATFVHALRQAMLRHHGTAGPAFLEWLVAQLRLETDFIGSVLAPRVAACTAALAPPGADGQVLRAARRLAVIAVGGELATEAGITGWAPGAAEAAVRSVFRDWIAARGGIGSREDYHVAVLLRRFIAEHRLSRFEPVRDETEPEDAIGAQVEAPLREPPRLPNLAGWRWQEVNSIGERRWVFGIVPAIFDAEIATPLGLETRDARRRLHDARLIRGKADGGKLRFALKPMRIKGHGQPAMIIVEPWILDGEAAEGD